jgi:ribose transport system ATP-binding protein
MGTANEVILEARNIHKTFLNVKALAGVDFDIRTGQVMALAGENGAGKSTLMKIIAAVYQQDRRDDSEIIYQGVPIDYSTPLEAKQNGIVLVFQELSLVPKLSVSENIFLGSLPVKGNNMVDWAKLHSDTEEVLRTLKCDVNPTDIVENLPIAQQQMVEISRAIALDAKILILDEPTSSLTDKEKDQLFDCIRELKSRNAAIVYISHKMDEIFEISDRITVFRDGRKSGECITANTTREEIISLMIGRKLEDYYHHVEIGNLGEEVLLVENLSLSGMFSEISFRLRKGEILGLYGLVGAGRTEIVETIFGIRKPTKGRVLVNGKEANIRGSGDAVHYRIGLVPENRKEQGLIVGMDCKWNTALASLGKISNRQKVIDRKKLRELFNEYREKLQIATTGPDQLVKNLSGGNQQKVVIGKWLAIGPDILMLDEPTRGIDVGAKAEIHKLIGQLAKEGMAVIVISSEMPEIIGMCSRVITVANGTMTGEFTGENIKEENIMTGIMVH